MITTTYILSQVAGLCAVACFIISFQIKSTKKLIVSQALAAVFFGTQFVLLGAWSGLAIQVVMFVRNTLMLKQKDWAWVRSRGWIIFLCVVVTVLTFLSWEGWHSILVLIATLVGNYVFWTNSARNIRIGNLFAISPCWMAYDIVVHAYAGVLNEIFVLSSVLISIYRFGWKNLGELDDN